MPNDDLMIEHERIAHHMFSVMLKDELYLAPIEKPKNVIDLGTGIGLCKSANQYYAPLFTERLFFIFTFFMRP